MNKEQAAQIVNKQMAPYLETNDVFLPENASPELTEALTIALDDAGMCDCGSGFKEVDGVCVCFNCGQVWKRGNFAQCNLALTDWLDDTERTRVEVWTRVMGYHRPIANFNPGKQGEHAERLFFSEDKVERNGQSKIE